MAVVLCYVQEKNRRVFCAILMKYDERLYAVVTAKPRGKPTKRLVDCTAKARTTYSMI